MTRLALTPIKGFAMRDVPSVRLDESGARGDRDFFVVDDQDRLLSITRTGAFTSLTASLDEDGRVLTLARDGERLASAEVVAGPRVVGKFYGHHEVPGTEVTGPFNALLSELAGQPVRLVKCSAPGAGSDICAVTLLGTASTHELSRQTGRIVDARRFRMLVEIETLEPHEEDDWDGRMLRGDEVELRVLGRVGRCAAITRDPDAGKRDLPLVKDIKAYRGMQDTELGSAVCFGVYAEVVSPGALHRGETLQLQP